jgi:protein TonB
MPANRRFGIATVFSVVFHAVALVVICLLAARQPSRPEVLIPIEVELTASDASVQQVVLGGGGQPEAPPKTSAAPVLTAKLTDRPASSKGGNLPSAPAPPRILTAKTGGEPSGPVGQGREPAGPGGQNESPGGPTSGPSIVGAPLPIYPKNALDQGLEGDVSLSVLIDSAGAVESVSVEKSSGHRILDDAAVRAVKQGWVFQPGLASGKPAPGRLTITFQFRSGAVKRG